MDAKLMRQNAFVRASIYVVGTKYLLTLLTRTKKNPGSIHI